MTRIKLRRDLTPKSQGCAGSRPVTSPGTMSMGFEDIEIHSLFHLVEPSRWSQGGYIVWQKVDDLTMRRFEPDDRDVKPYVVVSPGATVYVSPDSVR